METVFLGSRLQSAWPVYDEYSLLPLQQTSVLGGDRTPEQV